MKKNKNSIKVHFLGGVGEIGKNMTAIEFNNDIIVIDAGLTFPSQDMPGVDLVIPDVTFLIQNRQKLRGIILTHGHEDHIGALSYVLKDLNVPVYGTKLTLSLLDGKLKEQKVKNPKLNAVEPKSTIKLGEFKVEFITVNHSIPGAVALAIYTPIGTILHSGDFKVDLTPISGDIIDINADIICEKSAHKPIILGKGGAMIKKIATYARQDLEEMTGAKIFITLFVKVKGDWRGSDYIMKELGYDAKDLT